MTRAPLPTLLLAAALKVSAQATPAESTAEEITTSLCDKVSDLVDILLAQSPDKVDYLCGRIRKTATLCHAGLVSAMPVSVAVQCVT